MRNLVVESCEVCNFRTEKGRPYECIFKMPRADALQKGEEPMPKQPFFGMLTSTLVTEINMQLALRYPRIHKNVLQVREAFGDAPSKMEQCEKLAEEATAEDPEEGRGAKALEGLRDGVDNVADVFKGIVSAPLAIPLSLPGNIFHVLRSATQMGAEWFMMHVSDVWQKFLPLLQAHVNSRIRTLSDPERGFCIAKLWQEPLFAARDANRELLAGFTGRLGGRLWNTFEDFRGALVEMPGADGEELPPPPAEGAALEFAKVTGLLELKMESDPQGSARDTWLLGELGRRMQLAGAPCKAVDTAGPSAEKCTCRCGGTEKVVDSEGEMCSGRCAREAERDPLATARSMRPDAWESSFDVLGDAEGGGWHCHEEMPLEDVAEALATSWCTARACALLAALLPSVSAEEERVRTERDEDLCDQSREAFCFALEMSDDACKPEEYELGSGATQLFEDFNFQGGDVEWARLDLAPGTQNLKPDGCVRTERDEDWCVRVADDWVESGIVAAASAAGIEFKAESISFPNSSKRETSASSLRLGLKTFRCSGELVVQPGRILARKDHLECSKANASGVLT